ncbi:MAG: glycosyltransferase [Armatimonadetes bacterium]|nr:glycosyltransferase [Armatimonadota bacterium]
MRLTILTPTLNPGPRLESTLHSVLSQDYPRLEYRVIDGGSTDGTPDLLSLHSPPLHWTSEPDRGMGDAVNKGFDQATGEVIGWINSSDTYVPGAFEAVMQVFSDHPEVDFVYGDCAMVDEADRLITLGRARPFKGRHFIRRGADCMLQPIVFFRRRLLPRVGGCDITLTHGVAYDLWCRMVQIAQPMYLPEVLVNCRALPRRRGQSRLDPLLAESRQIRKRYLKGFADHYWSWYYDLRVNLMLKAEPHLHRSFPERAIGVPFL